MRWKQWRLVQFRDGGWRLYDIERDPAETENLAGQYPEIAAQLEQRYADWLAEMEPPRKPVRPPEEMIPHTNGGHHARRPFGRGWMTAERWDKIKDDPSQWSETAARKRFFEAIEL